MKKGYLFLMITFFCWGSLYVVGKIALECVAPMTLLLMRQTLALAIIAVLVFKAKAKKIKRCHIPYFMAIGFCGYFLSTNLQTMSTNLMPASLSSLVNSVNPIFISILAIAFLKEKINLYKVLGIIASIIGVCIVIGVDTNGVSYLGILFALLSVLFWSISSIVVRKVSEEYSSLEITFWGILFAMPYCLVAAIIELQTHPIYFRPSGILAIVYMAIFSTTIANLTYNKSLSILDASTCSLFYPLQTVFASILGIVLLHESIGINFIIGGILISAGIMIGVKEKKEPVYNELHAVKKAS